jgi:integrase
MVNVFTKGKGLRLYFRLKTIEGPWKNEPTPYHKGHEQDAVRYATAAQLEVDRKRGTVAGRVWSVTEWAEHWLEARETRGLASFPDDKGRINNHVLPRIGPRLMHEVTPLIVRDDLVRPLKKLVDDGSMGARTAIHVIRIATQMFRSAVIEEVISKTPFQLEPGEVPSKADKDPEWRAEATYLRGEVVQLVTDMRIPPERRIQYALKALAGLRHGEVAGLRWRHYDVGLEPLHRLMVARTYQDAQTKTRVTRLVPVHPVLQQLLAAWRALWPDVYGDEPTADDFIVPTRNLTPVDASDAGKAFVADLEALGLRVTAGSDRNRGGHDLRAWFLTQAREDGADGELLEEITHTKKKTVIGGYTRFSWSALCSAMLSLRFDLGEHAPLEVCSQFAPRSLQLRNRYVNKRPRRDSKPSDEGAPSLDMEVNVEKDLIIVERGDLDRLREGATLLRRLADAVLLGDQLSARRLAAEVRAAQQGAARGSKTGRR